MLKQLIVKNFALIQEANINFEVGYTAITGETGSGKSILLNALNLLLGERADYKVIGSSGEKAVVEAVFTIKKEEFQDFFNLNDIDFEPETIIRREITTQGRSRAFINDIPVQLATLKELTENLISIHSQYNTLELKRKEYQIQTLDILADTKKLQSDYALLFEDSKLLQKEIESNKEQLAQLEKDKDYNDFQLKELEELNLEKNNFSDLEKLLSKIENSNEILQLQNNIVNGLGNEGSVIEQIQSLKAYASKLTKIEDSYSTIEERLQSSIIELKDLVEEISTAIEQSESLDELQKNTISELLDKYNRVLVKHKCSSEEELKALYNKLQDSNADTESLRVKIEKLEVEFNQSVKQLNVVANQLHASRSNAITNIETKVQNLLAELKLPDTRLEFRLEKSDRLHIYGNSSLSLFFSANKGIAPVEIEKAASGGELSRVMLALQQLISEQIKLPTIFFDEIDTGVSGDVAEKIGLLLRQMGKNMQLFAISHLPQVAAKASHHLKVEKSFVNERNQTSILTLNQTERIEEIARLMSGEKINDAAISNAKALMN